MDKKIFAMYGLKYNPFIASVPTEALYVCPRLENFYWRIENSLMKEGGFALVSGDPGSGKSVILRLLSARLERIRDVQVGVITRSSARLADFYRELGDIFGVSLNMHNRWIGFKNLRERWSQHLNTTLIRPILLIDEAQELPPQVLNELRLLTSSKFDSNILLTVILAGDQRFNDRLGSDELLPLGSRIRTRFKTEHASTEQLMACLQNLLDCAGNAALMTRELKQTLCEHSMGNYRVMCNMAAELLGEAAQQEKASLDEKLFLEYFSPSKASGKKRVGGANG